MSLHSLDDKIILLEKLVNINSGSSNIQGVNEVQMLTASELNRLGFHTYFVDNPNPDCDSGKILIGELIGANEEKFISFLSHADTVFEKDDNYNGFLLERAHGLAGGPGVIDIKGGTVIGLSAIEEYLEKHPKPPYSLRFISSPNEEVGSTGFHDLFRELSEKTSLALGLEPCLDDGSIVNCRQGNKWYEITVHGIQAHSGRAYHFGVNAAVELANKIVELDKLTDVDREITMNIGAISSVHGKFNIVCGHATTKVDLRYSDPSIASEIHSEVKRITHENYIRSHATGEKAKSELHLVDDCPPFCETPESINLINEYVKIIQKVESKTITAKKSGGASDCNYFSRPGLPIIDGLGAKGTGMHKKCEKIELDSLQTRSSALAELLGLIEL